MFSQLRKQHLKGWLILLLAGFGVLIIPQRALSAKSFFYPEYKVELKVNKDSTLDVRERLTYQFDGNFRGVIRKIKLSDIPDSRCESGEFTCGGYERVVVTGVYKTDGRIVDPSEYQIGIESVEDGPTYLTVKWEIWPDSRLFQREEFSWEISYKVFGAIKWIGESESGSIPYLYWNALPEDRGGIINKAEIAIEVPEIIDDERIQVYSYPAATYSIDKEANNRAVIHTRNLPNYGDFTISYGIARRVLDIPAHLSYFGVFPMFGTSVVVDGINLGDVGGKIENFPSGKHTIEFRRDGYVSKVQELVIKPGEVISLDSNLDPGPLVFLGILISLILILVGIVLIPLAVFWVYLTWQRKGKDTSPVHSIYPIFEPPAGMKPYLLGSLKDERVDFEDVTATLIDLAYRGHLVIIEEDRNRKYKLVKKDNAADKLDEIESDLLQAVFRDKTEVMSTSLSASFYFKFQRLQTKIYQELVSQGLFSESPDKTRKRYSGYSLLMMIGGAILVIALSWLGIVLLGVPGPFTLGIALFLAGVGLGSVARHMPAKTALGSKKLALVRGFKMYIEHAERYRLQNLQPEEFEKFLSYAIVFGVEKKWAKSFEDIYKQNPEWLKTNRTDLVLDSYWVSRIGSSFSGTIKKTTFRAVSSSGYSATGGSWTGRTTSFGGFSGGGGGGGVSGAF